MRRSHVTLTGHLDESLLRAPSETLALVDLESYPAFLGKKVDYFDMMAHLSDQMQALTVMSWRAPDRMLSLRLVFADGDDMAGQMRSSCVTIAGGNLRTCGRLCLTTHERLFDSARSRRHLLPGSERAAEQSSSQLVEVPPGIYSIVAYYHVVFRHESGTTSDLAAKADYTVLLRHYPFPPPRVAPIRLSNGILAHAGGGAGDAGAEVITSHARIW